MKPQTTNPKKTPTKRILLGCFVTLIISLACHYPKRILRESTGLNFTKDATLCIGSLVGNKKTCEPNTPNWKKANSVAGLPIEINKTIFQELINNYIFSELNGDQRIPLGDKYDLWNSDLNDPKQTVLLDSVITQNKFGGDFLIESYSRIDVKSLYLEDAIRKARIDVTAEAEKNDITLSASFFAKFESELRSEINKSNTSSLRLYFVITEYLGSLSNGTDDNRISRINELKETLAAFDKGHQIIVGVCGFVIARLKSTQTVVESSMINRSFDVSLKLNPLPNAEVDKLDKIKAEASGAWSSEINTSITSSLTLGENSAYFYPLWIKTTTKKSS